MLALFLVWGLSIFPNKTWPTFVVHQSKYSFRAGLGHSNGVKTILAYFATRRLRSFICCYVFVALNIVVYIST